MYHRNILVLLDLNWLNLTDLPFGHLVRDDCCGRAQVR